MNRKVFFLLLFMLLVVCVNETHKDSGQTSIWKGEMMEDAYKAQRRKMVVTQIQARGVTDPRVLKAMRKVPRHLFVPLKDQRLSYEDHPLAIGYGQTISQPYIVALMTEVLRLEGDEKVLEIGTGSGYQAAVLSELSRAVFTIEIKVPLAKRSKELLARLKYSNVQVKEGDGFLGWPEEAPFDAIMVTCAPKEIPLALLDQLAEGGRLVIPVGDYHQELKLVVKEKGQIRIQDLIAVRFVPMLRDK